jgi:cytochrome c
MSSRNSLSCPSYFDWRQYERIFWLLCIVILAALAQPTLADPVPPGERAVKEEIVPFVRKAIAFFKANGEEKALAEFSNPDGKFIDRDLYIIAYDTTGITLAHGANPKLVDRYRMDEQDSDGVFYIRDRIEMMKTHANFWQHYRFTDPLTHKILPKTVYCEVVNDTDPRKVVLCSGVYDVTVK